MKMIVLAQTEGAVKLTWQMGIVVLVALAAILVVSFLAKRLEKFLLRSRKDDDTATLAQVVARAVRWTLTLAIVVVAVPIILGQLGFSVGFIVGKVTDWLLTSGPAIAVTSVLIVVALKASNFLASKLVGLLQKDKVDVEAQKRVQTLDSVVRWLLRTGILVIGGIMLLDQMGVKIGPILATAGVVGLAVGFGAQSLVQDIISGFFILLEDQVRVGDVVELDGRGGLVEKITLRMIILRDFSGNVHYVRNGKIDVVTNMTKEFSFYVFDIGVAYREDVDEVMKVMAKVGEELQNDPDYKDDVLAPVEVVGLDKFADSAVVVKARVKTKPIKQWRVGREFNRRLKKKFDELGIEIPFPHLTLYPGKDKKGDSPTLKLEIEGRGDPHLP